MTIQQMVERMKAEHTAHGTDVRCPTCNAGIGKWCIGTERLAGPTDGHPSHQERLVLAAKAVRS